MKNSSYNSVIRILKSILFTISIISVTQLQNSYAQQMMEKGRLPSLKLNYYLADSDTARNQTMQLQAAQMDFLSPDAGEDIAFCLDDGIYVQFSDGTGRRKLIGKGTGYFAFMYPAWSLDGKYIAFGAVRTTKYIVDLIVANADGSNPTVITSFYQGVYSGYIQSISWAWDNQYLMFTYAYDDVNLFSYFALCTIKKDGTNFSTLSDLTRSYCQYEPVTSSTRYAYISTGSSFDQNTRLRVSNLNGTNDVVWFTFTGAIAGMTHVCWKNTSSIYAIIRNWSNYPGKEVLVRIDKTVSGSNFTVLVLSDAGKNLWSPTLSADRSKMYITEATSTTPALQLITFAANGTVSTIVSKGLGLYPNWRQTIPPSAVNDMDWKAAKFSLAQNYPNPFNPNTSIKFSIPKATHVILSIYNAMGQKIADLLSRDMDAGTYATEWNASCFASGIYYYRIQAGSFAETKKMIFLK
jgi:hypothetical protein